MSIVHDSLYKTHNYASVIHNRVDIDTMPDACTVHTIYFSFSHIIIIAYKRVKKLKIVIAIEKR